MYYRTEGLRVDRDLAKIHAALLMLITPFPGDDRGRSCRFTGYSTISGPVVRIIVFTKSIREKSEAVLEDNTYLSVSLLYF